MFDFATYISPLQSLRLENLTDALATIAGCDPAGRTPGGDTGKVSCVSRVLSVPLPGFTRVRSMCALGARRETLSLRVVDRGVSNVGERP